MPGMQYRKRGEAGRDARVAGRAGAARRPRQLAGRRMGRDAEQPTAGSHPGDEQPPPAAVPRNAVLGSPVRDRHTIETACPVETAHPEVLPEVAAAPRYAR